MTTEEILQLRMTNQQLSLQKFHSAKEVVSWLGAVQAQDFAGAKWAVGQRMVESSDELLDAAFAAGEILRTHVMHPTWHFVAPEDIRWLLMLTAPRVHALSVYYYRMEGLDKDVFEKSNAILAKELAGGKFLTRGEMNGVLKKHGIGKGNLGLTLAIMRAELDGVICSGPKKGKQFTYALLEERVPQTKSFTREEALAELTKRYFISHGPSLLADFAWWSGLTLHDAKKGVEMNRISLLHETVGGKTYYFVSTRAVPLPSRVFLLPNYDEYGIAYKDRGLFVDAAEAKQVVASIFGHMIVWRGKVIGMWRREWKNKSVVITPKFFTEPQQDIKKAFEKAALAYAAFLQMQPSFNAYYYSTGK